MNEIETDELCVHGCGKKARFINKSKKLICESNSNKCEAIRVKNSVAVKSAHLKGKLPGFTKDAQALGTINSLKARADLATWHRTESPWELVPNNAKKDRILFEQGGVCEICKCLPFHNGKPLNLQLDHINGKQAGDDRSNLRLICPNCHSQTETFCSKNVSTEGKKRMIEGSKKGGMNSRKK